MMNKPLAAACLMLAACGSVQVEAPEADTITPLEQACLRDPLDPERWEQLAAALAIAGERERAAAMYLQAASLRAHDVQQDYATLKQALNDGVPRTQVRQLRRDWWKSRVRRRITTSAWCGWKSATATASPAPPRGWHARSMGLA
jgi:predicted Zn-dependent protease